MSDNYTPEFTPVEKVDSIYLKRDDLYKRAGICGGKVRTCWYLATEGDAPCDGLITASARKSPQAQIVARIAHKLGVPARCHMPNGAMTEEMEDMVAHGGELVQHKAGYNNVIIARAKADHKHRPTWRYIPFGMEHRQAVEATRKQVQNLPKDINRIVICVGSGMSAAGVLWGVRDMKLNVPVLGVQIGADPTKRLNNFGPFAWRESMKLVDITGDTPYHTAVNAKIRDIVLDPHYEAKCYKFLEPGDLFWIVGVRHTKHTMNK